MAAVEDFDEGCLIFLPEERRIIKINRTAREVLRHMDGKQSICSVIDDVASVYEASLDSIRQDISAILADLEDKDIITDIRYSSRIRGYCNMDDNKYCINHNVSCRIEDSDGAILFNPETDTVQVVNPTGLAIWQVLENPCRKSEIVHHLMDVCEGVPEDQVVQDIDEFIEKLKAAGFVGEVIE